MTSLVCTFAIEELVAGRITKEHPGTAVRMYIADEILSDGLDVRYEILGGDAAARAKLIEESEHLFGATFKVTQDRPAVWRAHACFTDLSALEAHPVFGAMLAMREDADRAVLIFEDGLCIVRLDFDLEEADPKLESWRVALAEGVQQMGDTGAIRVAQLDRSLEDWQPLA